MSRIITVTTSRGRVDLVADSRRATAAPIVCLHGLQGDRSIFDPLLDHPGLRDYTITAVDLPGFGDTQAPVWFDHSLDSHAAVIRAALAELGIGRCHVVGHSLGGMIGTLLLDDPTLQMISLCSLEGGSPGSNARRPGTQQSTQRQ